VYNIGVIGMGIGEKHALSYQNHPKCKLKTLCDFDSEKFDILSEKFPDQHITDNARTVINDDTIDIVSIASYDNYHSNQIIQAIKHGKHIMAEKPLCLNRKEMEDIYSIHSKKKDVKLSANHVLRTNSRFERFKNDIKKGEFGNVFYLEGDYFWGRKKKLFGWRAEMDFYSIILGAAIHMIDLVMWMLDSRPVFVQAMGNDISTRETNLQFKSFAVILLKFENGVLAKLTGNGGCVHPHFHGLKIFGTKRTAIHNLSGAYYLNSNEPDSDPFTITEPYPEKETRGKVIHSFVDSILDPSIIPLVPEKDVYDVMSVCFAAEEAMTSGEKVEINYLD